MRDTQEPSVTKKQKKAREIAPSSVTLPINRACQIYGLSYKTLRAAAFRGELAIVKIGRSWYLRRTEIERFLESHTERFQAAGTR